MPAKIDLAVKIGSMALIRREDNDIDYNLFSRLGGELRPGMALISSGATEIGRLDYMKRTGRELTGDPEDNKTDYAAQGQAILMETWRRFIAPEYQVRQVLVEHNHFNDRQKRAHLKGLLMRCAEQNAIPVINYNDAVSDEENRKLELRLLHRDHPDEQLVECVDNDETAAVVSDLIGVKTLVLLTSADGIYLDANDPGTLVRDVTADSAEALTGQVRELMTHCVGASRAGANGAGAKLNYALRSALKGVTVIIGSAKKYRLKELLSGGAPCTRIMLKGAGGVIS